jgi:hypothetical protein
MQTQSLLYQLPPVSGPDTRFDGPCPLVLGSVTPNTTVQNQLYNNLERTATIVINGQSSESRPLPQAGLPQGSPLSPILFLFFNADLVQTQIDRNGGAIAFVDDYTA